MKRNNKIALAAALLCATGNTLAQEINPSWYLQPSLTAIKPDADFGSAQRDVGAGFKFGKPLSPMWDLQFGASHVRAEDGPNNYHQTLLGADALLMLSRKNFRPFLLFGAGAQRDKVDNPLRQVNKSSPYLAAGLGFQLGLSEQWALQADIKSVRGLLRDDTAYGFSQSNNKYLTVGLNYALGKKAAPAPAPAPPPAPMPEPAPVAKAAPTPPPVVAPPAPARFEKITLSATELFAFDSAQLRLPQPKLDAIASALVAEPAITDVDVTGYADRLGAARYNQKLSERRANAVRDYLVAKGVDGARLKAYGKGETNPVVLCKEKKRADLIQCLEPNRRVEVEQITIERRVQ